MKHNKLVRDKIPDIIARDGVQPVTRILDDEAYRRELGRKLSEEVAEFGESGAVEELADVLEVVYALAAAEGASRTRLEALRVQKRQARGGFDGRVFLVETISDRQSCLRAIVGSTNPVKIAATAAVLERIYGDDPGVEITVEPLAVESGVPHQPWGNDETLRGAINRARAAQEASGAQLGVGLEGGLLEVGDQVFTCAWCAVARDDGVVGTGGGASVLLPPSVAARVRAGSELGPAVDELTGLHDTKQKGGAIGALTQGWLTRQSAYEHVLTLAMGKMLAAGFYEE